MGHPVYQCFLWRSALTFSASEISSTVRVEFRPSQHCTGFILLIVALSAFVMRVDECLKNTAVYYGFGIWSAEPPCAITIHVKVVLYILIYQKKQYYVVHADISFSNTLILGTRIEVP